MRIRSPLARPGARFKRAGTALTVGLALGITSTVAVFAGCSEAKDKTVSPCAGATCAALGPELDFSANVPRYSAHFRVLDAAGKPLDKANVQVGNQKGTTDADGRVTIKDVDAKAPATLQVTGRSAAPYVGKTDAFQSGKRTQSVTLSPLAFAAQVDLEQIVTVQKDFGRLELEASSIAEKTGTRSTKARLEVADLASSKERRQQLLPMFKAVDRKGAQTALKSLEAMAHVKLMDASGQTLNLAATKTATLELRLPAESKAPVGGQLSLWSLDETSLTLHEEGTCVVSQQKNGGGSDRICKGHVTHFSIWAVGEADRDLSVQCLNARVTVDVGSCFKVQVERVFIESCDAAGDGCHEADFRDLRLSSIGTPAPATCGIVLDSPTQCVSVLYNVEAGDCRGADKITSGRRIKRGDAKITAALSGGDFVRSFAEDASGVCSETCGAREVEIARADLEQGVLLDRDDDGYYAGADDGFTPPGGFDCDDQSPHAFPGAPELFCSDGQDLNCDGVATVEVDDASFNAGCALCGESTDREVAGNFRDEDCDGSAEDRDGDGASEASDCDDFDPVIGPGRSEVHGNQLDEDCDGVAADWDGDGALSSAHLYLKARLELAPNAFGDCDDFDATTFPLADVKREAGALSTYFEADRRSRDYCGLFDTTGLPNASFHALLVDHNCDGKVTDADGDGYAAVGDLSLGAELATDCDDLDPRVHTQATGGGCATSTQLDNESVCRVPPRAPTCPTIGLSGGVVQTTCEEALDRGVGTGAGVCAFLGWSDGDALTLEPGKLWGPCDGGGPLPECPEGAQCGGPLPFATATSDYLESTYTSGRPLTFTGMCFPKCSL